MYWATIFVNETAVKNENIIPIISETANPLTNTVPNIKSVAADIIVVRFESTIADIAPLNPLFIIDD